MKKGQLIVYFGSYGCAYDLVKTSLLESQAETQEQPVTVLYFLGILIGRFLHFSLGFLQSCFHWIVSVGFC